MDLDGKLLTVGLVLILFLPIAGLFLWRWWRGEARFYGFWVTPREVKAQDQAARRGDEAGPAGEA